MVRGQRQATSFAPHLGLQFTAVFNPQLPAAADEPKVEDVAGTTLESAIGEQPSRRRDSRSCFPIADFFQHASQLVRVCGVGRITIVQAIIAGGVPSLKPSVLVK